MEFFTTMLRPPPPSRRLVLILLMILMRVQSFCILFQIESAMPTLGRPIMSLDANEDAILGALKQSLVNLKFEAINFVNVVVNWNYGY